MASYEIIRSPWVTKAAPIALTVGAGIGVVGTAVLAAQATPKALEKKAEAEKQKGEPLTTWEKFKAMAPSYLPAAAVGAATLGNIAGMAVLSNRRQAELASLVAGGNQIINRISRKYGMLRDEVKEKQPDILKEFDQRTFDQEWNEYVKRATEKKRAWCGLECFPDCSGLEWGVPRMFGIEYGNGLSDENGNEYIFFEATPGDVVAAFFNLNGIFHQDGIVYVNQLFSFLNLPRTELGDRLVWDPSVLWDECESDVIGFYTEELPMEDDVPQAATCTMIYYGIPPLAEGYAAGEELPDILIPRE